MKNIQKGYVRVGEKPYALPLQKEQAEAQRLLESTVCALRPDRDNEDAILAVAEQDYTLLTDMVLTHAELDYRVMSDIVHGIASDWTQHPEAAQNALLIALDRPEALIQEEALRGLDKMWRAQAVSANLAEQVGARHLAVAAVSLS